MDTEPDANMNYSPVVGEGDGEIAQKNYPRVERKVEIADENLSEKIVRSVGVSTPPALFHILLKKHTNLNKPPSNWLYGSSRCHVHKGTFPFENFVSSLSLANRFLELTGIVDVISDSKNIKKLLKMTLSKANVSLIVHRVNNTLLLDNFDIHSLLKQKTGTWELFRKFYFEKVAEDVKLPVVERKNKSRDHLQSQNMFSKLLYYCLGDEQQFPDNRPNISEQSDLDSSLLSQKTVLWNFEDIRMLIGTDLPIFGGGTHPCVSLKLRDMRKPISVLTGLDNWLDNLMCNVPDLAMCYHDNGIVQSYELLKTEDIPNCSDWKFSPNVIMDIAQNILSFLKSNATKEGHTYWLFKAHGGDIVKLYDLTTLSNDSTDDSKDGESCENPFTVPVGILFYRLARNLRMRQTCPAIGKKTKVIKKLLLNSLLLLDPCKHYQIIASCHYFLSDLFVCDHIDEEPASSESNESDIDFSSQSDSSDEEGVKEPKSCKKKDTNCGATSSIRLEALTMHRKSGKKRGHPSKKKESMLKEDEDEADGADKDFVEKSLGSFEHISKAFKNVEKFKMLLKSNSNARDQNNSFDSKHFDELAQCNPNEAIPLHYSPLSSTSSLKNSQGGSQPSDMPSMSRGEVCEKKYFLAKSFRDIGSPFNNTSIEASHWLVVSKIFLLRKAAVVFIKRAEFRMDKFEVLDTNIIQDVFSSIKCFCAFSKMIESAFPTFGSPKSGKKEYVSEAFHKRCRHDPFLFAFITRMLGDAYLRHAVEASCMPDDDRIPAEDEQNILNLIENLNSDGDFPFSFEVPTDKGECFTQSLRFYDLSYNIVEDYDIFSTSTNKKSTEHSMPKFLVNLLRLKANAANEYGKFFMHQIILADGSLNSDWPAMIDNAQEKYRESFKIFKQLNDKINAAIVLLNDVNCIKNHAKLMRNSMPPGEENLFLEEEKSAYRRAESYCLEGLSLIEKNKKHRDLYETYLWELSSILIHLGSLLQENISKGRHSEDVKEMIGEFEKALKYCSFDKSSSRYLPAQYRKGHIHHRLAAFYLSQATSKNKKLRKSDFSEACRHYETSYSMLAPLKDGLELLGIQLEMIVLAEAMSGGPVEAKSSFIRVLQHCSDPLEVVVEMLQDIYDKLFKKLSSFTSTLSMLGLDDFLSDVKNISEALKLVSCLQNRLSTALILLIKECRMRNDAEDQLQKLKAMYSRLLMSHAISFKWNTEQNEWQELLTKISSTKNIFISNRMDAVLDDGDAAESEENSSAANIDAKPDLTKNDSKLTVTIHLSKIKDLLEACKSLNSFMSEFRKVVTF